MPISSCCAGLVGLASLSRSRKPRKEHQRITDKLMVTCLLINSKKKSVEEEYTVDAETLGEGGFGRVQKISNKRSGASCVMKSMVKEQIPDVALFVNEMTLQSECDHPHIARLYETFEDTRMVYIIMESCEGGDLLDITDRFGHLCQLDAWHIFRQLINALCYLHSKVFIVHRDLKPENMLIKERNVPLHRATMKLIDFGFAQRFRPGEKALKSCCGTPYYMCPEIFVDYPYNEKCDLWSAGVILYLLLSGDLPFDGESTCAILARVREGRLAFADHVWDEVEPSAQELICELCAKDPSARPSAVEVLNKTWMRQGREQMVEAYRQTFTPTAAMIDSNLKGYSEMNLDDFKHLALGTMFRLLGINEIEANRDTFESLDEGTGVIQVGRLKSVCSEGGMSDEDVNRLCSDLGNVEEVSYSTFLACNVQQQQYQRHDVCWDAFRIFDKDGDGQITLEEFRKVLSLPHIAQSLGLNGAGSASLLLSVDKNRTGTVTFDEFIAALEAQGRW